MQPEPTHTYAPDTYAIERTLQRGHSAASSLATAVKRGGQTMDTVRVHTDDLAALVAAYGLAMRLLDGAGDLALSAARAMAEAASGALCTSSPGPQAGGETG